MLSAATSNIAPFRFVRRALLLRVRAVVVASSEYHAGRELRSGGVLPDLWFEDG